MGSTTIQARFGEDNYPIGRFILDRARALGMSRSELVHRLGYREIGNGHRVLAELLTTGTMPQRVARHLADALHVDEANHRHLMSATARQQRDEAGQRTLPARRREGPHARPNPPDRQAQRNFRARRGAPAVPGRRACHQRRQRVPGEQKMWAFQEHARGQGRSGYQRDRVPTIRADPFCFKGL